MALYLGNKKVNINLNGILCHLNAYEKLPEIKGVILYTAENYILKDSNGLILTAKEENKE